MKFISAATVFFSAIAAASPVLETRQTNAGAKALVGDLDLALKQLVALNTTLNGFNTGFGSIATALKIRSQNNDLIDTLQKGVNDAKTITVKKLSGDDALLVANSTINLVDPADSTIDNLIRKKPVFQAAVFQVGDLSKTVFAALTTQRNLTNQIATIVVPKLPKPYSDVAPEVIAQLLAAFDRGIEAFRQCGGKFCLPPIPKE